MSDKISFDEYVNSVEGLKQRLNCEMSLNREFRETNKRLEEYGRKGIETYKAQIEYLKNKVIALEMLLEKQQHLEDLHKNSK